jgi:DNA-directed RNA polymerase specialized sigma24 family protein
VNGCKGNAFLATNEQGKIMKTKSSHFDRIVARYYPAVYSFAARLTDDPREAIALTRQAFNSARKPLQSMRNQTTIATLLISAVLHTGLTSACPGSI